MRVNTSFSPSCSWLFRYAEAEGRKRMKRVEIEDESWILKALHNKTQGKKELPEHVYFHFFFYEEKTSKVIM